MSVVWPPYAPGSGGAGGDLSALTQRVTNIESIHPVGSSDSTIDDIRAVTQATYDGLTPVSTTHYDVLPD